MIEYISETHQAHAKKMPPIRSHWTQERDMFDRFIKGRIPTAKMHVEQKRLVIEVNGNMWVIRSGQYLVFRDDGHVMVMFPSNFHDVWKRDVG